MDIPCLYVQSPPRQPQCSKSWPLKNTQKFRLPFPTHNQEYCQKPLFITASCSQYRPYRLPKKYVIQNRWRCDHCAFHPIRLTPVMSAIHQSIQIVKIVPEHGIYPQCPSVGTSLLFNQVPLISTEAIVLNLSFACLHRLPFLKERVQAAVLPSSS